uniref:Uncharacterized protein n=1 Tax=Anguilla anguilla TaxID=7936 RepID=A0A0E9SZS0_ANGAN
MRQNRAAMHRFRSSRSQVSSNLAKFDHFVQNP